MFGRRLFSLTQGQADILLTKEDPLPPPPWSSSCSKSSFHFRASSCDKEGTEIWRESDSPQITQREVGRAQPRNRLSDLEFKGLVIDQRNSIEVMVKEPLPPSFFSLDAQSLSHMHANQPVFRIWINLASSVKEGQVHFVILCLLTLF